MRLGRNYPLPQISGVNVRFSSPPGPVALSVGVASQQLLLTLFERLLHEPFDLLSCYEIPCKSNIYFIHLS